MAKVIVTPGELDEHNHYVLPDHAVESISDISMTSVYLLSEHDILAHDSQRLCPYGYALISVPVENDDGNYTVSPLSVKPPESKVAASRSSNFGGPWSITECDLVEFDDSQQDSQLTLHSTPSSQSSQAPLEEIKNVDDYDASNRDTDQLRDDWRLLTAHWHTGQGWDDDDVLDTAIDVVRELSTRGTIFHPNHMTKRARNLFDKVYGILASDNFYAPHVMTEEEVSSLLQHRDLESISNEELLAIHKDIHHTWEDITFDEDNVEAAHSTIIEIADKRPDIDLKCEGLGESVLTLNEESSHEYEATPYQDNYPVALSNDYDYGRSPAPDNPDTTSTSNIEDTMVPFVLTTQAVSLTGSICYGHDHHDIDWIVRAFDTNVVEAIRSALYEQMPGLPHHVVPDSLGPSWDYVPVADLFVYPHELEPSQKHSPSVPDFAKFLETLHPTLLIEEAILTDGKLLTSRISLSSGSRLKLCRLTNTNIVVYDNNPDGSLTPVGDLWLVPRENMRLVKLLEPEFRQVAVEEEDYQNAFAQELRGSSFVVDTPRSLSASDPKLKPLAPFTPCKATSGFSKHEFTDLASVSSWVDEKLTDSDSGVVVEPKFDGIRIVIHKDGDKVALYTEDKQRDRAEYCPAIVDEVLDLPAQTLILDTEFILLDDENNPLPRWEMTSIVNTTEPIERDIRVWVHDLLHIDGDQTWKESTLSRIEQIHSLLSSEDDVSPGGNQHSLLPSPFTVLYEDSDIELQVEYMASYPESEGCMLKAADYPYETGTTPSWAKFKLVNDVKVQVIGVSKKAAPWPGDDTPQSPISGPDAIDSYSKLQSKSNTYRYHIAIVDDDDNLVPIHTRGTLTEGESTLRWVVPGKEDPVTGNEVSGDRGRWKGLSDRQIWEYDGEIDVPDLGSRMLGTTYTTNVKASIGDIITVIPQSIMLEDLDDEEAQSLGTPVSVSFMFPTVHEKNRARDKPNTISEVKLMVDADTDDDTNHEDTQKESNVPALFVTMSRGDPGEGDTTLLEQTTSWRLPPFASPGGKYYLAPMLVELLPKAPEYIEKYIEPFVGAGSVLFAKGRSQKEVINDASGEIAQAWKDIQALTIDDVVELRDDYNWSKSRSRWEDLHDSDPPGSLVDRLYWFLYRNWYSYGGSPYKGFSKSKSFDIENRIRRVDRARHRVSGVSITNSSGTACLGRNNSKGAVAYIDPPYPSANHHVKSWTFDYDDLEDLADTLRSFKGKFLLSMNDDDKSKEILKGFNIKSFGVVKGFSSGRPPSSENKRSELLVANYDIQIRESDSFTISFPYLVDVHPHTLASDYGFPSPEYYADDEPDKKPEPYYGKGADDDSADSDPNPDRDYDYDYDPDPGYDWYMVEHDVDKFLPSTIQYHVRGIYHPDALEDIRTRIEDAGSQKELDAIWSDYNDLVWLDGSIEDLITAANKAAESSDEDADSVSDVVSSFLVEKTPPVSSVLDVTIGNLASVHLDWRCPHPDMDRLVGSWTCDVVKTAFQTTDDELYLLTRDKVIYNRPDDNWVCQKKCDSVLDPDEEDLLPYILDQVSPETIDASVNTLKRFYPDVYQESKKSKSLLLESIQPLVWLNIVSPDRQLINIRPGEVGATKNTAARIIFVASTRMVYGMQKPDFHEHFHVFEEFGDIVNNDGTSLSKLTGRWDFRLIPTPESSSGYDSLGDEFWMGARPNMPKEGQLPYVLTHSGSDVNAEDNIPNDHVVDLLISDSDYPLSESDIEKDDTSSNDTSSNDTSSNDTSSSDNSSE